MSEKNVKLIRKQIKNVVQSLLPEILASETIRGVEASVEARVNQRLDGITQTVKNTLDTIDQRSKDIQSYVLRGNDASVMPAPTAAVAEAPAEKAE